ncbi:hypothetical protein Rhal01_01887 [Rubritalea halochordaticola]|uniref:Uncharacterized protein n=1 Tax=Rubritalea halochordaticola TaxID=714537 RepID=A0ABP9UZ41_9BACT
MCRNNLVLQKSITHIMSQPNPYAAPQYYSEADLQPDFSLTPINIVVTSWEKLRVWFNLILLFPGIGILIYAANRLHLTEMDLIRGAVSCALVGNFLYFFGPLLEFYICAVGKRNPSKKVRHYLFIGGIAVAFTMFAFCVVYANKVFIPRNLG